MALLLIAGGVLGLVYHPLRYTKDSHETPIGPVELSVAKKETVDVPQWIAIGAIVAGAALLVAGGGAELGAVVDAGMPRRWSGIDCARAKIGARCQESGSGKG